MIVEIKPSKACGSIVAPPSKSMAHRALICGALSEKSVIKNVDFCKDITATIDCLKALGTTVKIVDNTVEIGGLKLENIPDNAILYCNESGSTLRFLLPICMACGKRVTLTGSERLFERPLDVYEGIAIEQRILFEKTKNSVTVCGKLRSSEYIVLGNISSQFITGYLFALHLLERNSTITITKPLESASYVDLTVACLADFGVKVERQDSSFNANKTYYIKGSSIFENREYVVEGDCSNAAFLEAFNYIGSKVEVLGLNPQTLQGDRVYKEIFEGLKNGNREFDLSDCPDLAPVCFALAAVLGGAVFTGTKRLKIKESDRAEAMKQELSKFGIEVEVSQNSVLVKGGKIKPPVASIDSHNDHRIAMALSLLLSITGGKIKNAEAVSKSYPSFFEVLKQLGVDVNETY